ncbi:hypothetical protein MSG28_002885 [Choristoneura fumiferana]|uniref:Uncharacterized protein n=1 Tax=Choristoneura fumiferana TaxID=7141 RepID=A0ACC0JKI1_CHOFU|nr:hypothetical protein MSG28_002885 [Choristoneura fumiferana]
MRLECGGLYSNLRRVRISIGRTRNSGRQPAATLAAFSVIRRRAAASIMLLDASALASNVSMKLFLARFLEAC